MVAPELLGAVITHGGVAVRITEVEAYLGVNDPASHCARGLTPANAAMFGPPGRWYVYHSYGIHKAGNIVCHPDGGSGGVLLRAGEVISGQDLAASRRGPVPHHRLASGPGNLGKTLGLEIDDNGTPVALELPGSTPDIVVGPRIGITKNTDALLRFWIPGEPTISARKSFTRFLA